MLGESLRKTWAEVWKQSLMVIYDDVVVPPTPLKRFEDGRLRLICYTRHLQRSREDKTPTGIRLVVMGYTGATHSRRVSEEVLPVSATKAEQLRRLEFMCNLIAVQEGCDYKLVRKPEPLAPQKERTWPNKR